MTAAVSVFKGAAAVNPNGNNALRDVLGIGSLLGKRARQRFYDTLTTLSAAARILNWKSAMP
jgi:hypothetical protein